MPVRSRIRPLPAADPAAVKLGRRRVLAAASAMLAAKLFLAATTFGTRDINHWRDFVGAVARYGPAGIYAVDFPGSYYNHPPAIGYLLEAVHFGTQHGVSLQFSIRALASLADVGTALLVFELMRRRGPLRDATLSAALVGLSPVLFVISGYHGNTDPIFIFLTLLALFLLADTDRPGLAGLAIGLALGIKLVPMVVIPLLAVYALRTGRAAFIRFAAGGLAAVLVTWLPAGLSHADRVRSHVLEYAGANVPQWGIIQIGHWLGDPGWAGWLAGSGRFLVVLVCAAIPAAITWRAPERVAQATALALVGFLFLSPAFGSQYTVWAVAPAYLLTVRWATVYNLGCGALLIEIYTRWNHSLRWNFADEWGFDRGEVIAFIVVWAVLGVVLLEGGRRVGRAVRSPASTAGSPDGPPDPGQMLAS